MHFRIFIFLLILLLPALVSANSPEESAKEMAYLLTENLEEAPLEVEVGSLLLEGTPVTSKFADKYLGLFNREAKKKRGGLCLSQKKRGDKRKVFNSGAFTESEPRLRR